MLHFSAVVDISPKIIVLLNTDITPPDVACFSVGPMFMTWCLDLCIKLIERHNEAEFTSASRQTIPATQAHAPH